MKIYITIDGGTTNTRVNLVKDRQIIDTRKIARGAKAGIDDKNGLKVALKDAIRDLLDSNSIDITSAEVGDPSDNATAGSATLCGEKAGSATAGGKKAGGKKAGGATADGEPSDSATAGSATLCGEKAGSAMADGKPSDSATADGATLCGEKAGGATSGGATVRRIRESDVIRILASGMITSEFGLYELPHLTAPAGIKELHDSMAEVSFPEISPIPFVFIRGIKVNSDKLCDFDMMRGEETELVGIKFLQENSEKKGGNSGEKGENSSEMCENSSEKCEISSKKCANFDQSADESKENWGRIFVLPGSHSKIIRTDRDGRVVSFSTMLTGEMLMSLSQSTILKDAVDISIGEFDREHLIWGCKFAIEEGLNKSLFKVRILKNAFKANPVQVYSFFVGAVLSDEIRSILSDGCREVVIGGNHQIKEATATLIKALSNKSVTTLSDSEVAASTTIGAISIFEY